MKTQERRSGPKGGCGATAVEFALLATPCLMLIFAIVNFAVALYTYDFVCYTAQEAARYAIVNGATSPSPATAANIETYVDGLVVGVLNTNQLSVNTTWNPNNKPGSVVTVQVSYVYQPVASFVSSANITMTRTAAMVISQ
ncbi:MAG TPA: TadE family protein [Candidatus Binataceae bacterium]|nr:TadE family protein [Candidatus Binataceae bacterium]